jgi:hypothetical protein
MERRLLLLGNREQNQRLQMYSSMLFYCLYLQAGADGKPTVFLFTDTQVLCGSLILPE